MSSYLLSIGAGAEKLLTTVMTAFSCGAAQPVDTLRVFSVVSSRSSHPEAASLADSLSFCHRLMAEAGEKNLFQTEFCFQGCVPSFRSVRSLSEDPDASLLFSALRGKGLPLSLQTDREAVEWCFADLLSRPDDPSVCNLFDWLEALQNDSDPEHPSRLFLLADLTDPFAAGVSLAFLRNLPSLAHGKSIHVTLLALADTFSSGPDSFFPALSSSLKNTENADAVYLLSLPSSIVSSGDSFCLVAVAAARLIGKIHNSPEPLSKGFRTLETDGTLSLASLGDQALPFISFVEAAAFLLADLVPSLKGYLSHPARLRSLAPNVRNTIFRHLFSSARVDDRLLSSLSTLERTVRILLGEILRSIRSVPEALRISPENTSLWQDAVNACGRYITVAAELDAAVAEAHESGLDTVRPVHRDSLDDTEEEQLLRRLKDMELQLQDENRKREKILGSLGGYRALQVQLDCLQRCRSALHDAKIKVIPPDTDRLAILKQERRIRLLEAAVARCEAELDPSAICASVSAHAASSSEKDPWTGSIFSSDACGALEKLLIGTDSEVPPRIPPLSEGFPETDPKARLKSLWGLCKDTVPADPLSFLFSRVLDVCREELSPCRFPSSGVMPPLPLLPDLIPDRPPEALEDLLALFPADTIPASGESEKRGLLAMLLLRQYRRRTASEAGITCTTLVPGASPVLRYWLNTHHTDQAFLLSLEDAASSLPFALILPGTELIPARRSAAHRKMVPSFVVWYDRDKDIFSDPCSVLGEGDRALLISQLTAYTESLKKNAMEAQPLYGFLCSYLQDLSVSPDSDAPDSHLPTRLQAVCGLLTLPAYSPYLSKTIGFYEHFLSSDLLGNCFTGRDDFQASACSGLPDEILYLWKGIPFARENSRGLLESSFVSEESYILSHLSSECQLLNESSDDYRDAMLRNLREFLNKYPDAFPSARSVALDLMHQAGEPLEKRDLAFTWPWDPNSPSMLTVLRECLGDAFPSDVLSPFSDRVVVFPARGGDVIGDSLLASMCIVFPEHTSESQDSSVPVPDAVLPPFSPSFARALCSTPEGRTMMKPSLVSFERYRTENMQDPCLRVILTLDGAFPIRLIREYAPDEIISLYSHDIPTLALWPSMPFRPADWNAYYVYANVTDPFTLSVLQEEGDFIPLTATSPGRFAASLSSFPVCFALSSNDVTLGCLPNLLPEPKLDASGPQTVNIDFGSSGISVVFSSGRYRKPMQGPVMVRTLLNNPAASRDLLRREFLPAVPVSALLPTVSRLFRNVPGAEPIPFIDGIVLMSSTLEDLLSTPSEAIYTSLKWEGEKGRSGFLCLHQVMLIAALQARSDGASELSWRFSLPDEMAKEGREALMNLFLSLSVSVQKESGYSLPPEGFPVSFASDSSALGAYFRFCSPEETRGGFMVLDLGACIADISLFLRGREQAVRTCQLPLGIQYMLLPALMRDPDLIAKDFSFCSDPSFDAYLALNPFRQDLSLLTKALRDARTDPVALRRARVALDFFISDHLPLMVSMLLQMSSAGSFSRIGALLLLYLAFLMMLSGLVLLQLASDPSRNDFLPERMALCISGRGASLFEVLPQPLKIALWRFLTMFRNNRVSSLSMLFSAEKKMEIPVGLSLLQDVYSGLPPVSAVPASIAVRPSELLPEFLLRFYHTFPSSANLLFPGVFSGDAAHPFMPRGSLLIDQAIKLSFPPQETPRPYDSLASFLPNLLELVNS